MAAGQPIAGRLDKYVYTLVCHRDLTHWLWVLGHTVSVDQLVSRVKLFLAGAHDCNCSASTCEMKPCQMHDQMLLTDAADRHHDHAL